MDKLKQLKGLFKKDKSDKLELELTGSETEADFWNAAWDEYKIFIADQFVQSMVPGSEELAIPVPFLTDANHFELSATATQSLVPVQLPNGQHAMKYMVRPSVFTIAEGGPAFTKQEEKLANPQGAIGARYGSFDDGDFYEVVWSFHNPKILTMPGDWMGVNLHLDPDNYLDGTEVYVVDKVWVCKQITGTLKVKVKGEVKTFKYDVNQGHNFYPDYGITVCFKVTKYGMTPDYHVKDAPYFDNTLMRGPWEKADDRTTAPQQPTA